MITVYDLETFRNFFSGIFLDVHTEELKIFVIHDSRNDLQQLIEFLRYNKGQIGFNNLAFDYPILHWIIEQRKRLLGLDSDLCARQIYKKSQEVIDFENNFSQIRKPYIKQLDLYKIWHFDNKAKSTSLKDVAMALKWHKIQDLPYEHTHHVLDKEIESIISYNINDVLITYEFYKKSLDKIRVNIALEQEYKLPLLNYSDPKIGEQLFLKFISDQKGMSLWQLKQQRTFRDYIDLNECIVDYAHFKSEEFNKLLNTLKS